MKAVPCIMAVLAAVLTVVAVISKLAGSVPMGVVPSGMLALATVLLLFGINHSLCQQCMKKE